MRDINKSTQKDEKEKTGHRLTKFISFTQPELVAELVGLK